MTFSRLVATVALVGVMASPAFADSTRKAEATAWSEIRAELYDTREIAETEGIVTLTVPYRAADDRRVPIEASANLAPGQIIKSFSLIIDENPMPVSAVFDFAAPFGTFDASVSMRINGPSTVRAVVETTDGQLFMTAAKIKTSGVGACAAPPINGTEEAFANLGKMDLKTPTDPLKRVSSEAQNVTLEMSHPQHSGMQMDQITLLYILARYIETVDVWADDAKLFTMTGSISVSEDPAISFSLPKEATNELRVRMTDTEEAVFERRFPLGGA